MIRHLYENPKITEWVVKSLELLPKDILATEFKRTGSVIVGRTVPQHFSELFEDISFVSFTRGREQAVLCSYDGLIASQSLTRAIFRLAVKAGVEFHLPASVTQIEQVSSGWKTHFSLSGDERVISSEIVINAAGAWLSSLSPVDKKPAEVKPYRRHLFKLKTSASIIGATTLPHIGFLWDETDNFYLRRLGTGEILFSICEEESADQVSLDLNKHFLEKLSLYKEKYGVRDEFTLLESRSCFRTYSPSRTPILEEAPNTPGYFIFGAFGGFGMSSGFGAAAEFAEVIGRRLG